MYCKSSQDQDRTNVVILQTVLEIDVLGLILRDLFFPLFIYSGASLGRVLSLPLTEALSI